MPKYRLTLINNGKKKKHTETILYSSIGLPFRRKNQTHFLINRIHTFLWYSRPFIRTALDHLNWNWKIEIKIEIKPNAINITQRNGEIVHCGNFKSHPFLVAANFITTKFLTNKIGYPLSYIYWACIFGLIQSRLANKILDFFSIPTSMQCNTIQGVHVDWRILEWNVLYCLVTVPFEKVNKAIVNPQMGSRMNKKTESSKYACMLFILCAVFSRLTAWHRHCNLCSVHETVSLSCSLLFSARTSAFTFSSKEIETEWARERERKKESAHRHAHTYIYSSA